MLFAAGSEDALFPLPAVREAFATLQAVWRANGAAARLETRIWPGGHQFTAAQQDAAFDWLDVQFGRPLSDPGASR
jgi:predicted esterase